MKVCTDACLFGAWAANLLNTGRVKGSSILDIGTGTGLLSLMLAQGSGIPVTGVEIEAEAAKQASENVATSIWSEQIDIVNTSILDFAPGHLFDFIISNPPFFEGDLTSPDVRRNKAMHDTGLTLVELMKSMRRLMAEGGHAAVLLPYHRLQEAFEVMKEEGLGIIEMVLVKQSEQHNYFRAMILMGRHITYQQAVVEEISIRAAHNVYSEQFTSLLKPYYLYL